MIDAEQWQEARALFREALDLDPDERSDYLDRACAERVSLRPVVERLLVSLDEADDFLEEPAAGKGGVFRADPYEGLEIKPYRLVKRIGQGGMGMVYLAVRADEAYEKRVAVKLLRPGEDGDEILRRFRAERQILAGLDHPSIAKLLDGGSAPDGTPYLVMEHIEGKPIDEYCDRLTVRERLELFRVVCSAVHFAHQNLVVHRDLKPSNILVTGDGTPKLLDFGIAKLLNPELSAQGIQLTATALRLMTPEYASPEQVRGDPITTASDVYSLGVLLYQLLCGHLPYEGRSASAADLVRAICDEEPAKLSSATGHRLASDLDNIVRMAMRKEARRRYASAEQLAADVRCHLEGRPVSASGDSFAYRSRKFIRRHRIGVALTAVVASVCVGFGVVMGSQRAQLARERDRAEEERGRAERVTELLVGLFEVSDPYKKPGDPIRAEEILEVGARRFESELQDEPSVRARLWATVGKVYRNLGHYDASESHYRKALEAHREVSGSRGLETADVLDGLAAVLQVRGDYEAAEDHFRQALSIRRRLLGNHHCDVSMSLRNLASLLGAKQDPDSGYPFADEALRMRRELFGDEHPLVADSLDVSAKLLASQGHSAEAEKMLREALRIRRRFFGDDHPLVGQNLGHLAPLLFGMGRYAEAEPLYREALRITRKQLGNDHPAVGTKLNNLANLLLMTGGFTEAKPLLFEALEILRRRLGNDSVHVAASLTNLAAVLQQQGDLSEAEELLLEALEICRRRPPEEEVRVAYVLHNLAKLTAAKGELSKAEVHSRAALEIFQRNWAEDNWKLFMIKATLGEILGGLGRYREAEKILLEAYSAVESARGKESRDAVEVLKSLIALYETWGRPEQAARYSLTLGTPPS